MKRKRLWLIITPLAILLICFIGIIGFVESRGLFFSTGRYLKCGDSHMIIMDSGSTAVLSYEKEELFDGLSSGDKITILNDAILESYPSQTKAYYLRKDEEGTAADLPQGKLNTLREMGWIPELDHTHAPTTEDNTISDEISGFCGNTTTELTVYGDSDETYEFWGDKSVELQALLLNLEYDIAKLCKCEGEYFVGGDLVDTFSINLTSYFVTRYEGETNFAIGQAVLSEEQARTISEIVKKAENGELDTISFYH